MRYGGHVSSSRSHGSYFHTRGHLRKQCSKQMSSHRVASERRLSKRRRGARQCHCSELRAELAFDEQVDVVLGIIPVDERTPAVAGFDGQQEAHPHCTPQPPVAAQVGNTKQLADQLGSCPSLAAHEAVEKLGQQTVRFPAAIHFAQLDFGLEHVRRSEKG